MENQEIMEKFLENRQNYMMDNNSMNMNVASAGCDTVVGGVQAEVGVGVGVGGEILGVKYEEEHDVGDDDELKYVKELQQSEKQQQQSLKNFGLDDELAEKEISIAAHHFGNGDGGFVFGGDHHQPQQQQQHHDLFNMGNGHNTNGHDDINIHDEFSNYGNTGFEEKLDLDSEVDAFKHEGDFTSISNVTESTEGIVLDVKIETKSEQHEMVDEEEPSSLATNTTNGTSSLSENVPPQVVSESQVNEFDNFMTNLENKENADPLAPQRPNEIDLEQGHSQLNPDAKEFVPNFGSNPASPTSPFATSLQQNEPVLSETMETQMYFGQAPSAVPRHLLGDDDFIAQSPRKGKDDNNMDAVPLPEKLSEFEEEADKRPHELETEDVEAFQQRDEVMTPDQAIHQLPLDDLALDEENLAQTDSTDFQPSTYMDHGPETSVDHETDLEFQTKEVLGSLESEYDVMRRSMYVASDDTIENVLNSVQPIPTEIDSVNNSFTEESATESAANQLVGDKELLQVEEKEHVSHSPSTEEIQTNLQNVLNSSNKDICQLSIDMDNANNMQESMYVEHESQEEYQPEEQFQPQEGVPQDKDLHMDHQTEEKQQFFQGEDQQQMGYYQEEHYSREGEVQHDNHTEEERHLQEQQYINKQPHEGEQYINKIPQEEEQQQYLQKKDYHEQQSEELDHKENYYEESVDQSDQSIHDELLNEQSHERLQIDTTNTLIANDSFLDNSFATHDKQQEVHEPFSPFEIDDVSTAPALDSLKIDVSEDQQQALNDVLTPSSTADEKHLLEETKEQQLLPVSGLEQQTGEMMLSNDAHLSQAEEVAAIPATNTIEDISENLTSPDEVVINHDYQTYQDKEKLLVDESFNQLEQQIIHKPHQESQHEEEMQMEQERQFEPPVTITETKPVDETIESPIQQEYKQELESEIVSFAKESIQETEAITKPVEYAENEKPFEKEELPPCIMPETASSELLEPAMEIKEDTEIAKIHEEHTENENLFEKQELPPFIMPETTPSELLEPAMDIKKGTEIAKTQEEHAENEKQELPPCIMPETAPSELLEPAMEIKEDTEIAKIHEEHTENENLFEKQELPPFIMPESTPSELLEPAMDIKKGTEIAKTQEEHAENEKQELPPCIMPETASSELLEPTMDIKKETEIAKTHEEQEQQKIIEKVITEMENEPVVEKLNTIAEESVKPKIIQEITVESAVLAATAAVAATAATAATAVGAKVADSSSKKTESAKKSLAKISTTTAKTKVGATPPTKKPTEVTKKPVALASKPRAAAPAKVSVTAIVDKKPITKTTTTTTARKPLSATSAAASKVGAKTSNTISNAARSEPTPSKSTARPITAPRTVTSSTTTTRKPVASSATTNGPLTKPRPATAPTKPTTLGLSATNGAPKTNSASPRATSTAQARKTAPAKTAAKSPLKSTTTNGVTKTTSSTLASKTKTTTLTVPSTGGTGGKTFTARPAPKFISSSTTTTTSTRHSSLGTTTTSSTTTSTKNISAALRKSSPTKPATGRTPIKSTTAAGASKSKTPSTKTESPTTKPAPIRKPVDKSAVIINGEAKVNKELNGTPEKIIMSANEQIPLNGDLQAVQELEQQQNGDSNIPIQAEDQSLIESRYEQIPMDNINA